MAIVAAGIIIALSVIYTGGKRTVAPAPANNANDLAAAQAKQQGALADNLKPVDPNEHILGNPNAKVKIVEFSDIECPFCKRFHPTIKQIMDEYGKTGQVAWVYRHFPLQMHPKATPEAIATECVWEQGGNTLFWKYLDGMFDATLSNNQSPDTMPADVAKAVGGVDMTKFNTCMETKAYASKVQADIQDGLAAGVTGTPYSIVIAANGKKYPVNGAQPYESVKAIVDLAIKGQ